MPTPPPNLALIAAEDRLHANHVRLVRVVLKVARPKPKGKRVGKPAK